MVKENDFSTVRSNRRMPIFMLLFNDNLGAKVTEKAMAPHQYSCLENPMDGGAW